MQRRQARGSRVPQREFQCPLRWAGRCNCIHACTVLAGRALSFSALFVGQGDATVGYSGISRRDGVSVPSSLGREMQRIARMRPNIAIRVSVPSSLGREMQPQERHLFERAWLCGFSALFVGQGDATARRFRFPEPTYCRFSALFVGQGDATLIAPGRQDFEQTCFSALFVGQGDATRDGCVALGLDEEVSVPSSLGREMQLLVVRCVASC